MSQTQQVQISDEEREARAYVFPHRWQGQPLRYATLGQLWDHDRKTLIEMSRWRHLQSRLPRTFEALRRFLAIDRIGREAAQFIRANGMMRKNAVKTGGDQFRQWGL